MTFIDSLRENGVTKKETSSTLRDYLAIISQHLDILRKVCSYVQSEIHYSLNGRIIAATIVTAALQTQWAVISAG